jgi:hypothetical protein
MTTWQECEERGMEFVEGHNTRKGYVPSFCRKRRRRLSPYTDLDRKNQERAVEQGSDIGEANPYDTAIGIDD